MSYDLLAFDPNSAPRDREAFKAWWAVQSEWGEGHSYDDPINTTPALQAWYDDIRRTFPNMNGPGAPSDEDLMTAGVEDRLTDYSIGQHVIYAAFPWPLAEEAYDQFRECAARCEVGFYEVSTDPGTEELFFPGDELGPPSQGSWRQIAADFRSGDLSKYMSQPVQKKRSILDFFRRK